MQLEHYCEHLYKQLQPGTSPVKNNNIADGLKQQHKILRDKVYQSEKELLEIKYKGNVFIADTRQCNTITKVIHQDNHLLVVFLLQVLRPRIAAT